MADVLERGNIFFLYRPAVGEGDVEGLVDVQRFYLVLKPQERERLRLLIVGHKRLPDLEDEGKPYWGFVDEVGESADALRDTIEGADAGGPARAVGEGVYAIVRHQNHTDLAFALELPEAAGEAQRALHIPEEARYVLTIKNPEAGAPPGVGLDPDRRAQYPPELQERFGDERFTAADPPDFLDHPGCEFLLISGDEGLEELGITLETEHEDAESAEVLRDLKMDRDRTPLEPLLGGQWR